MKSKAKKTQRVGEGLEGKGKGKNANPLPDSCKKPNCCLWLAACSFWLFTSNFLNYQVFAQNPTSSPNSREQFFCSEPNLEILTTQLLQDLPSYANRVIQRARRFGRKTDIFSYVLAAGRPEFTPLPLNLTGEIPKELKYTEKDVKQVFFTTLERQYIGKKAVELQQFHWLFLAKAENGWWMVMMFSRTGSDLKQNPPTPPQDSSHGVVAQGIQTWLRDCRAGDVRF
ncbi:hypothetical protein [Fischerella thermalis]|uniref:hypothetical protein n=1 Tax=Fischerella thermalis TaxID=372787 RepID=UPI000C80FF6B|nr:hypothetical protein [Fischerella thermalis]MBF1990429.1 hypothetical protein [Fischerella thermalis M58_A2018_009]MBF2060140.1 hypothetical protein [Fischerella thermalis M66_A2018_004]MBF2071019.1 hypothetical protein [Fischerella thermalis M48_A2018_028]PLZ84957.1 hypothetical protein CI593_22125 [Fischerella thermalis CCMEE 5194]